MTMLASAVVVTKRCDADEAAVLWRSGLDGLDDPEAYLGPGVTDTLPIEDRYYRLQIARGPTVGLGWTRRFGAVGYVRWYGLMLLPESRRCGLGLASSGAVVSAIFRDYPETTTVLAMIHSSNPRERWRPTQEGRGRARYVGEILAATPAGVSLHLMQITRESWNAWPELQGDDG